MLPWGVNKINLFNLFATISLNTDEYDRGLSDAEGKTSGFADKLKSGLATAAKVGAAALTAAATGIAALTKASLDNYAEYEQLVGGVDTLFKDASAKVQEYADNAYKTAGMSANEYMDTVTSFSASLLQSLDGDTNAAAEKADRAITDMSDNANKMGTSMESIQNAYQGFAKQNYTMLDNLKLGYGGTKEEMERLLEDAEKLSGQKFDISSYADIVDAIHVVQTEMGITGTTAAEAASTISGSISSMKSAWTNLITGLGNENADLDTLIGNLVSSAETAAGNIIPRITQILSGMGTAIEQLAPILAAEIPPLLSSLLPSLVSAGAQLLVGLITGLIGALPQLVAAVPEIVTEVYNSFVEAGPQLISAGGQLLTMLENGILETVPALVASLPDVVTAAFDFFAENAPKFIESGIDFIGQLVFGILDAIPDMVAKLPEVISSMTNYLTSAFPVILKKGGELLGQLIMGILGAIPEIALQLPAVITAIKDALEDGWEAIKDAGKYLLEGLWAGITDKVQWLKDKVSGVVDKIKSWFTGSDGFDEHSPSKWAQSVGEYLIQGLSIGVENAAGQVYETVEDIVGEIKNRMNAVTDVLNLRQDVGDLQYELWEKTEGKGATEAEKYAAKLEILNRQQDEQRSIVETVAEAYDAAVDQYGEANDNSLDLQKTLLEEKIKYAELRDEIESVTAAMQELNEVSGGSVSFPDSSLAKATEAGINAVANTQSVQSVTLNAKLVAPSGTEFADYYLPSFIKSASANGTPIINPT